MNTLNFKQQYAVKTPHKKVLIMAGAGTGKTTVLTPQNPISNSKQHQRTRYCSLYLYQ